MTIDKCFEKYKNLYSFEEGEPEFLIDEEDFKKSLKEFTEYHVNKALEKAANEATAGIGWSQKFYDNVAIVDKKSILNCYKNEIK